MGVIADKLMNSKYDDCRFIDVIQRTDGKRYRIFNNERHSGHYTVCHILYQDENTCRTAKGEQYFIRALDQRFNIISPVINKPVMSPLGRKAIEATKSVSSIQRSRVNGWYRKLLCRSYEATIGRFRW